jgi:hypothetical protein
MHGTMDMPIDNITAPSEPGDPRRVALPTAVSPQAAVYAVFDLIFNQQFDLDMLMYSHDALAKQVKYDFIESNVQVCKEELVEIVETVRSGRVPQTALATTPGNLYDELTSKSDRRFPEYSVWRRRVRAAMHIYADYIRGNHSHVPCNSTWDVP